MKASLPNIKGNNNISIYRRIILKKPRQRKLLLTHQTNNLRQQNLSMASSGELVNLLKKPEPTKSERLLKGRQCSPKELHQYLTNHQYEGHGLSLDSTHF